MTDDGEAVAVLLERIGQLARSEEQGGDLNPAQWAALRYLARANRFSRTPAALTRYLGTTRGTTSQTLMALERKGYVARAPSARDKRVVDLDLTASGRGKLRDDPVMRLADAAEEALGADVPAVHEMLSRLLEHMIRRNEGRMFGQCRTCRHFRRDQPPETGEPHHCGLLEIGLTDAEGEKICVEHEA